jgi:hypothetical protein
MSRVVGGADASTGMGFIKVFADPLGTEPIIWLWVVGGFDGFGDYLRTF